MENALGLSGYQATMMILVFIVLGFGIAALFAALFLPARWKLPYSMEFVFVGLLFVLVWYGDKRSTEVYQAYQSSFSEAGVVDTAGSEPAGDFDREIKVVAFQWGFAFLTEDEISRNAAVVKPGEKVLFRIFANDVIHGFNIPAAGITAEFEPGRERDVWIRAPQEPGKYLIQCLNYCGVGHAQMKAWLVVQGAEA
jgi:heme/copper-type cytochrome/quinol oxidase subunit 2